MVKNTPSTEKVTNRVLTREKKELIEQTIVPEKQVKKSSKKKRVRGSRESYREIKQEALQLRREIFHLGIRTAQSIQLSQKNREE